MEDCLGAGKPRFSFVRIISSFIPRLLISKDNRVTCNDIFDDSICESEMYDSLWLQPVLLNLADIVWLIDEDPLDQVVTRIQSFLYSSFKPQAYSTPSGLLKKSPREIELETQLEELRSQMAALILQQEVNTHSLMNDTGYVTPPHKVQPFCAPPPPPPPPPPSTPTISVQEIIQQRKERNGNVSNVTSGQQINMTDVLKDLKNVKLRSVARSPGGTPVKEPKVVDMSDPAALIANALRRKFAQNPVNTKSPNVSNGSFDSENTPPNNYLLASLNRVKSPKKLYDSLVKSPATPGPHILRTTGKRALLLN